jgi:hypothetical protein
MHGAFINHPPSLNRGWLDFKALKLHRRIKESTEPFENVRYKEAKETKNTKNKHCVW